MRLWINLNKINNKLSLKKLKLNNQPVQNGTNINITSSDLRK